MQKKYSDNIRIFVMSVLSALALVISYDTPEPSPAGIDDTYFQPIYKLIDL